MLALLMNLSGPAHAAPPEPGVPPMMGERPMDGRGGHDKARLREREERMLERIQQEDPARHAELIELRQSDPQRYRMTMQRIGKMTRGLGDDPDAGPRMAEMATLMESVRGLSEGFADLPPRDQKARRAEMYALAAQLFVLRQEVRRAKLEHLRQKLQDMEAEIGERDRRQGEIIDGYLDELLEQGLPDF